MPIPQFDPENPRNEAFLTKNIGFLNPPAVLKNGDILTSAELSDIIAAGEKRHLICTYGTFGLFNAPEQACRMVNYSQFCKSSCRVAVNVIDNWVVRMYVKDEAMLQRVFEYAKTVDPEAYLLTEEDDLGIGN